MTYITYKTVRTLPYNHGRNRYAILDTMVSPSPYRSIESSLDSVGWTLEHDIDGDKTSRNGERRVFNHTLKQVIWLPDDTDFGLFSYRLGVESKEEKVRFEEAERRLKEEKERREQEEAKRAEAARQEKKRWAEEVIPQAIERLAEKGIACSPYGHYYIDASYSWKGITFKARIDTSVMINTTVGEVVNHCEQKLRNKMTKYRDSWGKFLPYLEEINPSLVPLARLISEQTSLTPTEKSYKEYGYWAIKGFSFSWSRRSEFMSSLCALSRDLNHTEETQALVDQYHIDREEAKRLREEQIEMDIRNREEAARLRKEKLAREEEEWVEALGLVSLYWKSAQLAKDNREIFLSQILPLLRALEEDPVVYPLVELKGMPKLMNCWARQEGEWKCMSGSAFKEKKQKLREEYNKLLYEYHLEAEKEMTAQDQREALAAGLDNHEYWRNRTLEATVRQFRGGEVVDVLVSNWEADSTAGILIHETMDETSDTRKGLKTRSDGSSWVVDPLGEMRLRRRVRDDYVVVMPYICILPGEHSSEGEKDFGFLRNPMNAGESEELPSSLWVSATFNSDEYRHAIRKVTIMGYSPGEVNT